MFLARLETALRNIDDMVSSLDLAAVTCEDAERLVLLFIKGERLCHAGKSLSARRAAEGHIHSSAGFKDPSSWLAEQSGEPLRQARAELDAAARLTHLDETRRAFRSGELSAPQAETIAEAATADPTSEKDLLELARKGSLRELRDECERVKAAARSAEEAEERYARIRRERYLRIWKSSDGATKGQFSLTPDAGAKLLAGLQPWADRFFEEARRAGHHESSEAYMADALVASVSGSAWPVPTKEPSTGAGTQWSDVDDAPPARKALRRRSDEPAGRTDEASPQSHEGLFKPANRDSELRRPPPPATVICRVDLAALLRGGPVPGEMCEIPGVGPVPVSTARELLADCFLKLVITDGVDVRTVVHYGRTLTAHQRTALEFRDPYCVVPGCGRSFGLENDHIAEFALGGPTSLDNLCRLCQQHHALKTHHGYKIRGGPGAWEWIAPRRMTVDDAGGPPRLTPPQAAPARAGRIRPQAGDTCPRPSRLHRTDPVLFAP